MANDIVVTIRGEDKSQSAFDGAKRSSKEYGESIDGVGEKADEGERRLLGLKDTVDGVGAVMQGPHGKQGIGGYVQGWADLAGGIANFVVPSIKSAWKGLLSLATANGRAALMANVHKAAQVAGAVAMRAMAIAQRVLNAAMRANPIGIIITVLALLVGGIILAYKKSETFRRIVQGAWAGIKKAAQVAWNVLKVVFRFLVRAFEMYVEAAVATGKWIRKVWDQMVDKIRSVISDIKANFRAGLAYIKDRWATLIDYITGIPGRIKDKFSNAKTMLSGIGRNIINGLKDGIKEKIAGIRDWIKSKVVDPIIKAVKDFFGIKSPSAVFAGFGGYMISGLMKGLMKGGGATSVIKKVFGSMPKALSGLFGGGLLGKVMDLPGRAIRALGKLFTGASGPATGIGNMAQRAMAHLGEKYAIGYCLRFVDQMAGRSGGSYDALSSWAGNRNKHPGDRNPPSGVPVYWGGGAHGHVAVSVGNGRIVTTDYPRMGRINMSTIGALSRGWGKPYLGWSSDIDGTQLSGFGGPSRNFAKYARGGWINEPVVGVGRSGKGYLFGEAGRELVTPEGSVGHGRGSNINVYASTNADPHQIAHEVAWVLRTNGR